MSNLAAIAFTAYSKIKAADAAEDAGKLTAAELRTCECAQGCRHS